MKNRADEKGARLGWSTKVQRCERRRIQVPSCCGVIATLWQQRLGMRDGQASQQPINRLANNEPSNAALNRKSSGVWQHVPRRTRGNEVDVCAGESARDTQGMQ